MPSYEYRCLKCNVAFTASLTLKEHGAGDARCPKCGEKNLEPLIAHFEVKTSKKS